MSFEFIFIFKLIIKFMSVGSTYEAFLNFVLILYTYFIVSMLNTFPTCFHSFVLFPCHQCLSLVIVLYISPWGLHFIMSTCVFSLRNLGIWVHLGPLGVLQDVLLMHSILVAWMELYRGDDLHNSKTTSSSLG